MPGQSAHPRTVTTPDSAVQIARNVIEELLGPPSQRTFRVEYWDESADDPGISGIVDLTIVLRTPGALRRMLLPPSELAIAEAYLRDDFDIDGNIEAATGLAEILSERLSSPARLARLMPLLRNLPLDEITDHPEENAGARSRLFGRRHSRDRDRAAVRAHYDLGNDFYALWLDKRMVYSCAYFTDEDKGLDAAQKSKLEHICRKLRLQSGERFLDIGCGWGSLVLHAAKHYGVEAMGITLSEPQAKLAREWIEKAGLGDRCRIEVRDYREFPPGTRFDKVASIGMVEHVGSNRLATYFSEVYRLLEPGGLFLNHGIVRRPKSSGRNVIGAPVRMVWRPRAFIDKYVFPDGELLPLAETIQRAEEAGFETRDVESLREHYAMTLRHWVRRLEARHEEAAALVGEATYRVWRLYMAGSARQFATARLNLVQTLLSKPDESGKSQLPLTRGDVYRKTRGKRRDQSGEGQ